MFDSVISSFAMWLATLCNACGGGWLSKSDSLTPVSFSRTLTPSSKGAKTVKFLFFAAVYCHKLNTLLHQSSQTIVQNKSNYTQRHCMRNGEGYHRTVYCSVVQQALDAGLVRQERTENGYVGVVVKVFPQGTIRSRVANVIFLSRSCRKCPNSQARQASRGATILFLCIQEEEIHQKSKNNKRFTTGI